MSGLPGPGGASGGVGYDGSRGQKGEPSEGGVRSKGQKVKTGAVSPISARKQLDGF